ncbi:hypothetical protein PAPYR_1133 [Paratrimastix pyriformis]|uniref:Ribosome biogenesis protein NOP53 n=1 Tax=Paratrimastix pyriformis TaxID=342808 RepID=A0ABQ8UVJ4_9EUKA|nr:hypothetical protein PAPYR_1133 [Paratrimastix pyriformis]
MVKKPNKAKKAKAKKAAKAKKVMMVGNYVASVPSGPKSIPDEDDDDVPSNDDDLSIEKEEEGEKSSAHRARQELRVKIKETKQQRLKLSKHDPDQRKKKKELTKLLKVLKKQDASVGASQAAVSDLAAGLAGVGLKKPAAVPLQPAQFRVGTAPAVPDPAVPEGDAQVQLE